jgi:two-component system sensor histidine kinase DegS
VPTEDILQKIEATLSNYRDELERTRREANEVEVLVRQSGSEVEKLTQRELSVANRVRDLEANLERYSKDEIRNFFATAQELQLRLQSMRSQLEQIQGRREALRLRQHQLSEMITLLSEITTLMHDGVKPAVGAAIDTETMVANIIQSQESERLRISLQMHDGPAQAMSNLVLRAEICQRLLDRDLDQARTELDGLKDAINGTLQDTRKFIFDLRPMILDDLGLVPTLRRYVAQFGEKNGVAVNLIVQNLEQRLPNHYEVTIFRFIQEALNNVAKHAGASQVQIVLDGLGGTLQILIDDDGVGFQVPATLAAVGMRRTMGIAGMRQLIEVLLRGEFGIESRTGHGTRVAATIPL